MRNLITYRLEKNLNFALVWYKIDCLIARVLALKKFTSCTMHWIAGCPFVESRVRAVLSYPLNLCSSEVVAENEQNASTSASGSKHASPLGPESFRFRKSSSFSGLTVSQ